MSTQDQLTTDLTAALTQVITDEGILQSAITAVQGVVTTAPTPTVDPNDALVTAVIAALTGAGYSVSAPAVPADPAAATAGAPTPAVPATDVAPVTPADTTAPAVDATPADTSAPELPATDTPS